MNKSEVIAVVGAGAAGFFAAIAAASGNPNSQIILLEKSRQPLAKVRISGGGRCNVTHNCFDPKELIKNYPRGSSELLGPFHTFQPLNTIEWFESRGIELKTEDDGRMFPITDSSQTIIDCLYSEANKNNVEIRLECGLEGIKKEESGFILETSKGQIYCDKLLLTTGSAPKIYELLKGMGHTIIPLVPSLFTFNAPTSPLKDLAGISSAKVHIKIKGCPFEQIGPLLVTHWGFSGPAALKLSAWAARWLQERDYKAELSINWLPELSQEDIRHSLNKIRDMHPQKQLGSELIGEISKQLWQRLLSMSGLNPEKKWVDISNKEIVKLINQLQNSVFMIEGKTTYKQEFVTCGGVSLKEVNFKTMESKVCPKLYFAGEILDIDGVTGGFNFQNAWTTGWIAGQALAKK